MLCFGVVKKLKCENIVKPNEILPKFVLFETENKVKIEIPVEVVEEGEIVALNAPYEGGSLVGTDIVNVQGSLGVNTRYKGTYRLLSAAHVLTRFDEDNIGKQIIAKSDPDEEEYEYIGATVTGQVPVDLYENINATCSTLYAKQDLAWANITEERGSPIIKRIGYVGDIRDPCLGELVQVYAGMSKDCYNNLKVVGVSVKIKVPFNINNTTKYGFFEDVVKFDITQAALIPGDSGSAIIAQSDKGIVGILMSCSKVFGYFTKLTY